MKFLKQNNWLRADSICVAQGSAVALNLMFESKKEHELFFAFWNKYLGGMTEVINYHLSPTTWTVLFRTKSIFEVKEAYRIQRDKSKKAITKSVLTDVSRMISEHFRIFLSQFVRQSNRNLGRKGTKVFGRFKKSVIEDSLDYLEVFDKLISKERQITQINTKYQADEKQYNLDQKLTKDSVWISGLKYYENPVGLRIGVLERVVEGLRLMMPCDSVLRKFIKFPSTPKITKPPPKSSP